MNIATHYDILGVAPDASSEAIRAAYRERARRFHPDLPAIDATGGTMSEVNEAYRVLQDPNRRSAYDRSLREPADAARSTGRAEGSTTDAGVRLDESYDDRGGISSVLTPSGPARFPWKLMLVLAVIGSSVVFIAAMFTDPPSEEPPDGIIRVGSCVAIESNGDAREIACTGVDDVVVDLLVPTSARCPGGTVGHRDRLGLGIACIEV